MAQHLAARRESEEEGQLSSVDLQTLCFETIPTKLYAVCLPESHAWLRA